MRTTNISPASSPSHHTFLSSLDDEDGDNSVVRTTASSPAPSPSHRTFLQSQTSIRRLCKIIFSCFFFDNEKSSISFPNLLIIHLFLFFFFRSCHFRVLRAPRFGWCQGIGPPNWFRWGSRGWRSGDSLPILSIFSLSYSFFSCMRLNPKF